VAVERSSDTYVSRPMYSDSKNDQRASSKHHQDSDGLSLIKPALALLLTPPTQNPLDPNVKRPGWWCSCVPRSLKWSNKTKQHKQHISLIWIYTSFSGGPEIQTATLFFIFLASEMPSLSWWCLELARWSFLLSVYTGGLTCVSLDRSTATQGMTIL
jgi:hypothetical protein